MATNQLPLIFRQNTIGTLNINLDGAKHESRSEPAAFRMKATHKAAYEKIAHLTGGSLSDALNHAAELYLETAPINDFIHALIPHLRKVAHNKALLLSIIENLSSP